MNRRGFLGWFGAAGLGLLAHHKPGHGHGRPPPTTTTTLPAPTTTTLAPTTTVGPTTTTTAPPPVGDDPYGDIYT